MADRRREAPLAMDGGAFRDAGHRLVDQIAELLDSLPARSVTTHESPSSIRDALDLNGALPEKGVDPATLLADLPRQLSDHSLFNAHPRFFGYITAPPAPIGILADFLASALNANVGAWTTRAGRDRDRNADRPLDRRADWISLDCGGLLVSGGNMANIVCLLAARAARAGWDVRDEWCRPRRRAQAARLRIRRNAHVDPEGGRPVRARHGLDPLDPDRPRPSDGRVALSGRSTATSPPASCRSWSSARRARSAPAQSIRCRRSPRSAASRTSGSTSTAPTAALPPRFRKRPRAAGARATPTRSPSIRTNGSTRRSRPAARWFAIAETLRAAFAYHPPYYHFDEQATNYVDLARRTRAGSARSRCGWRSATWERPATGG